ncbi:MAG: preprotein translocase subunit YajC [Bifidobacteriaceae bacterium]|nr:preprotein translocase subunit YajC [Bifidobacteriaceae bacterium]
MPYAYIIFIVAIVAMMFFQQRRYKKQQQEVQDFRENLAPGTEIITIGGIIGKIVSVDNQYEEVVIDSEGSLIRLSFKAINREYVRPAYVSDDEVDENGNPLPTENNELEADQKSSDDVEELQNETDTTVSSQEEAKQE